MRGYVENFPGVDVEAQCRKACQYVIDNPRKRRESYEAFVRDWLTKELEAVRRERNRLQLSLPRRAGDPEDGQYNDEGQRWSAFNHVWTPEAEWRPKNEMEDIFYGVLKDVYGKD